MDVYFFLVGADFWKNYVHVCLASSGTMKQDMEVDDVYMQVPKSPGESAFAGGKRPQRRSFRAWGLDPNEMRFTILHVFPGENWHHGIHDSSIFDGFLGKTVIHWKISRPLDWNWGPFGWLALIDMLMKKLAVNFIPDTSLIRGKLLWFQIEGFGSSWKLCWSHLMKLPQHSTAAWCGFQRCYWVASPCLTEPLRTCYIARLDAHFYPIHPVCLGL